MLTEVTIYRTIVKFIPFAPCYYGATHRHNNYCTDQSHHSVIVSWLSGSAKWTTNNTNEKVVSTLFEEYAFHFGNLHNAKRIVVQILGAFSFQITSLENSWTLQYFLLLTLTPKAEGVNDLSGLQLRIRNMSIALGLINSQSMLMNVHQIRKRLPGNPFGSDFRMATATPVIL